MQLLRTSNQDEQFVALTRQLDDELRQRYGELQDLYAPHNRLDRIDTALLGVAEGQPVACGCFKRLDAQRAEVKRMFVHPQWRRRGYSEQLLRALEAWARELGVQQLLLETGRRQPEAIALYHKLGFTPIAGYGPYVSLGNSLCMAKSLAE
jgi:GNAT superfamily N-acetyltransferase